MFRRRFIRPSRLVSPGLSGQPAPTEATLRAIRAAVADIRGTGNLGKARPALFTVVEAAVTADLTDELAPALVDPTSYTGLFSVYDDALQSAKGRDATYVRYNLVRLHLLRARTLRGSAQSAPLAAASRAAAGFDPMEKDPAVWELTGDIAAERHDLETAIGAYKRLTNLYGSAAPAQFRIGRAYQLSRRYDDARRAFDDGLRADAAKGGGRLWKHLLYTAIGNLALEQGRVGDAVEALKQSVKVRQDDAAPFRFRTELARALLAQGRQADVIVYAEAAVKHAPDDEAAQSLLRDARAGNR